MSYYGKLKVEVQRGSGKITIGTKIKNGKEWGNCFDTFDAEEILKYGLQGMATLNSDIVQNFAYASTEHRFEIQIIPKRHLENEDEKPEGS